MDTGDNEPLAQNLNDEWIDEIRKKREQGVPLTDIASEVIWNIGRLLRDAPDQSGLAGNLRISTSNLEKVCDWLEVTGAIGQIINPPSQQSSADNSRRSTGSVSFKNEGVPESEKSSSNSGWTGGMVTETLLPTLVDESVRNLECEFRCDVQNEDVFGKLDGYNFPHSEQMLEIFGGIFGLESFRSNQLEVVNAAMLGHDCFVVMPTGGGKSLCYQLTALLCPGVTVVVSPLRSLILDQVQHLKSLGIEAGTLSGDSHGEEAEVYEDLSGDPPDLKILYVTPEKISASRHLMDTLTSLHKSGLLARIVIDEAHCISQWGHDFRPDYTRLGVLKEKFRKTPCMVLTSTATERVRQDILNHLGIQDCKWFLSSLNRSNLKYEVRMKTGKGEKGLQDLVDILNSQRLKGHSGIVYCLTRDDCDAVAGYLKGQQISAVSYHAGIPDYERTEAQNDWVVGRTKVICATVAFGMGINKIDARFVIHYSVPKSIEEYYQESGRAGRDGGHAHCILLYSYQDALRIKSTTLRDTKSNPEVQRVQLENLNGMIRYCENNTRCRRAQLLEYFGEVLGNDFCKSAEASCDNCSSETEYEEVDVTQDCKAILNAVKDLSHGRFANSNFTVLHFAHIFKGSKAKKITVNQHDKVSLHGRGTSWRKSDAERLLRKLVLDDFLKEEPFVGGKYVIYYARLGPKAPDLMDGKVKITFPVAAPTNFKSIYEEQPANSARSTPARNSGAISDPTEWPPDDDDAWLFTAEDPTLWERNVHPADADESDIFAW